MDELTELTEAELDAVAGGQVFANQHVEATAIGSNPTIIAHLTSNITPTTAFLVSSVEVIN